MGLSIFIIIVAVTVIILTPTAEALQDIGIDISGKCKLLIKNNISSTCPTFERIFLLFPDTSPQHEVGKFGFVDGIFQREQPIYNIENFNTYFRAMGSDGRVWIDPPAGIRSSLKMITIESGFDDYPLKSSYAMSNNTIVRGTERFVNSGCTEAVINAENWMFLLGDSIVFMQKNCDPEHTNFNHIKKTYYEKSYQDIRTSYKYKLEAWIEESKIKCREKCFEY